MSGLPKKIHQIWIGGELPERYQTWVDGIKAMNPKWEHRLWTDESLTSLGLDLPGIKDKFWSPASATNYIRLLLINMFGGIYMDVDFEAKKPLDYFTSLEAFAAEQDTGMLCNAIFGAGAGHPWIQHQLKLKGDWGLHDAAWGVYTMSEAPKEGLTTIPTSWVYPFSYKTPKEDRNVGDDAFVVHHWDGTWVT